MAFDRRSSRARSCPSLSKGPLPCGGLLRGAARRGAVVPICGALALSALAAAGAHAQASGSAEGSGHSGLTITPTFSVSELWTTNRDLSATDPKQDLITQISPGISLRSRSGRVTGRLDYALNGVFYANGASKNETQHALNSLLSAELVDNWAFVDFSGTVSQQAVSGLRTQSTDNRLNNSNSTEVSSYSVSPYVRGLLGRAASYEARLTRTITSSGSSSASNSAVSQGLVTVTGQRSGPLGWSVLGSHEVDSFSSSRETQDDRVKATLRYAIDEQFDVSVSGGRESGNLETIDRRQFNTSGFGVTWRPSVRTLLNFERERRLFGNSHSFSFDHRSARTVWRFRDVQDISSSTSLVRTSTTAFERFDQLLQSSQPDAALREQAVNELLKRNGFGPNDRVSFGSLAAGLTVQRQQELSVGLLGLRDTITFTALRARGSRDTANDPLNVSDDFSKGNVLSQRAFNVDLSHRLTPLSVFTVQWSQIKSTGTVTGVSTSLRGLSASWVTQLGSRTSASLGARRSLFDSTTQPYNETAVLANMRHQF